MMMWKPVKLGDRLALVHRLGAAQMRRAQQPVDIDVGFEALAVLAEHLGGADGERRIEEDRRRRHLAALHQVDQIDDQFLRALDREGRNEQRAAARLRRAHLGREMLRGGVRASPAGDPRRHRSIRRSRSRGRSALPDRAAAAWRRARCRRRRARAAACRPRRRRRTRFRSRPSRADGRRSSSARARRASASNQVS